ncbi:MAG: methylaspartate ammonia-lyase [Bacillota bacterium]
MIIKDVLTAPGLTGFYFDDQAAIKAGADMDRFTYIGPAKTKKFKAIRQSGEALSIMLILEDGQIAYGDAAAVQYSGAGGRDELFYGSEAKAFFDAHIKDALIGLDVGTFKKNAETFDAFKVEGKPIHTALRYGITQALLDATAKANRLTMSEVVRREYHIDGPYGRIPVFAQSGDDRYDHADKMIMKEADVLPHALINNIQTKLGQKGELLLDYVKWLSDRILTKRQSDTYHPILHIDVYGTIGIIFDEDTDRIFDYLKQLEEQARPFLLRIEGPIDTGDKEGTIQALRTLKRRIDDEGLKLEIVADEWCNTLEDVKDFADREAAHMLQVKTPDLGGVNNTIEALRYCLDKNVGAYSGGSCNETNISSEVTTSIAIACNAKQCLAKPGMGTDEGLMIVKNHMARTLALIESRGYHE